MSKEEVNELSSLIMGDFNLLDFKYKSLVVCSKRKFNSLSSKL